MSNEYHNIDCCLTDFECLSTWLGLVNSAFSLCLLHPLYFLLSLSRFLSSLNRLPASINLVQLLLIILKHLKDSIFRNIKRMTKRMQPVAWQCWHSDCNRTCTGAVLFCAEFEDSGVLKRKQAYEVISVSFRRSINQLSMNANKI